MKTIPLTQGKVALVDDEDYDRVNAHKWCAHREGRRWYAVHAVYRDGQRTLERMHRFILDAGDSPLEVDHINGAGLDNRRINLRLVTKHENMRNTYKHRAGRLPGAYFCLYLKIRPWQARIRIDGCTRYLGYFETEREAHERFLRAAFVRKLILARLLADKEAIQRD
jgi:hypothetical protein